MKEYILIGHKIIIEEVWSDITTCEADPTINKLPNPLRLERIGSIHDLHKAIEDYFRAQNDKIEDRIEDNIIVPDPVSCPRCGGNEIESISHSICLKCHWVGSNTRKGVHLVGGAP